MTTTNTRRRRPATLAQTTRSMIAATELGRALPATITEAGTRRRFEHVTGIVPAGSPAADELGLVAGDAVAPAVLVIDRPGAMTCYVAVELAGAVLELEVAL